MQAITADLESHASAHVTSENSGVERVVSACESSILVWRRLRGTALSASQESTTSSLKPSPLPAINAELTKAVLMNTIPSVDVLSCNVAEVLRCRSPFGLLLGCSLRDTSHQLSLCYFYVVLYLACLKSRRT